MTTQREQGGASQKHGRWFVSSAIIYASVGGGCVAISPPAPSKPAYNQRLVVGNFVMPRLAGWRSRAYQDSHLKNVKQMREMEKSSLIVTFTVWKRQRGETRPTPSSLQDDINRYMDVAKAMQKRGWYKKIELRKEETVFQGMPAYLVHTKKFKTHEIADVRILTFTDRSNKYSLSAAIVGENHPAKAKKELFIGWNLMIKNIRRRD